MKFVVGKEGSFVVTDRAYVSPGGVANFRAVFVRVDAWRRCFVCRHRVRSRVGHYEATGPTVFNDGTFYLAHVCKECWDER
jgi:hypothetical protein